MRGQGMKRQHGRGRALAGRRQSKVLVCGCSQCGYEQAHLSGVPCREVICPYCGVPLVKIDAAGQIIQNPVNQKNKMGISTFSGAANKVKKETPNNERPTGESKQQQPEIPLVDSEKCTACGRCVDLCPRDAIELVNGVAHIIPELCINCRLCVRKCPEGALE